MADTKEIDVRYIRLQNIADLISLTIADIGKAIGTRLHSYKHGNFGELVLSKMQDALGINKEYIMFGIGEPLLPNSPELVYKYKNNIADTKTTLHPNINFRKIEDLPE